MKKHSYLFILLMVMGTFACKERFNPPEVDTNLNYLTVEGLINTSGIDSTIIRVNRTVKLTSKVAIQPELRAILTIESNDNLIKRNLVERGNGIYYALPFALDATKQYRLRIRTSGGKEYLSDYTEVKVSPPIDAVGFEAQTNGVPGVQIFANTHDDSNKSLYYKWDFVETYQYNANNFSSYIVENKSFRQRNLPSEDIFTCWRNINSNAVVLASSAKLTKDVINKAPILKIPPRNERLEIKYSIIVNQQVLTKEAFEFWEILKKNTEQVGSIFDAQPSQLPGNIHSVSNPSEIVIGFISVGTVQHKRIFIASQDVPREFRYLNPGACPVDTIASKDFASVFFIANQIPINGLGSPGSPVPTAYTTAPTSCIDCRLKGTNIQPAFWQ